MNVVVRLDKNNRFAEIDIPEKKQKVKLSVSREHCRDILLEQVELSSASKGKPLSKCLPEIKLKNQICKLRFTMNNFSTSPIDIKLQFK